MLICLVQGTLLILALENPGQLFPGYDIGTYGSIVIVSKLSFLVTSVIYMTAGTHAVDVAGRANHGSAASATACRC